MHSGVLPSKVYVCEEGGLHPDRFPPNRLVRYNAEFQNLWGDKEIYGNLLFVYSPKKYAELPAELKTVGASAFIPVE
jgi:hypothetical protein